MRVIIVGSGIGGLVCAIACRHAGLDVLVLEKARAHAPIGAGIQVPQNASRVLIEYGLKDALLKDGIKLNSLQMRRWKDGELLNDRAPIFKTEEPWIVIHRADYHRVLLDKAESLGVEIKLGIDVKQVDFEQTKVITSTGKSFYGDVIVGADGIWSILRDQLLGYPSPPQETGDLAYRATFSRASLESLEDPSVTAFINKNVLTLWLGAGSHAVFYPIRSGQEFNLVLACPDDLPPSVRKQPGNLEQMFEFFKDWDPILSKIISKAGERQVLKWKLLHHHELERWTKGTVALLGDACHPSLPYQAQGAAMAVEDAAVLGTLLGLYKDSLSSLDSDKIPSVPDVLSVYEALQKERSTINVRGAISNRDIYHMHDGPEQEERDRILKAADWVERDVEERFVSVDPKYWRKMLGRDSVADAKKAWEEFLGSLGVEK